MSKAEKTVLYRELIENAPMAMLACSQEFRVTVCNKAAADLFGILDKEAQGRHIGEFFACPDQPAFEWAELFNQSDWVETTLQGRTVCGSVFPARVIVKRFPELAGGESAVYVLCAGQGVIEADALRKSDEVQQRADLLNAIVDGEIADSSVAIERGRALGLDLSVRYALFAVSIDNYAGKPYSDLQKDQRGMKELLKQVTQICSAEQDKIVWNRYDGFVVLCPLPEGCSDCKAHSLARAKSGRERITNDLQGVSLTVGVSSSYNEILDIRHCFREAKEAANVGQRIWGGNGVYHYADLGICQLLTQFQDPEQLRNFVDRSLGKLIRHDETKKTQLVATLEEILSAPNLKEAAERSFVHHKTILFRKNRIEEILGVSIDDMETRLTLSTAVKILRLLST